MAFDRILGARPVNKTAGMVMSKGTHWEPDMKPIEGFRTFDAPPPCIPPEKYPKADSFVDMRGTEFGRFRVIGFMGKLGPKKSNKALWLVRCACGAFETRTKRAIENPDNAHDACRECLHLNKIKRRASLPTHQSAPAGNRFNTFHGGSNARS